MGISIGFKWVFRLALPAIVAVIPMACASSLRSPAPPSGFTGLAALALNADPSTSNAVETLADSSWWEVKAEGDANILTQRRVSWYLVRRRNPPLAESVTVFEDEATEEVPRLRVDAWSPDGGRWSADGRRFTRTRARLDGYFSTNLFRHSLRIPGYRPGLLMRVEVRRNITRPEFRGGEALASDYACRARFLSFRAPAERPFAVGLAAGDGMDPVIDSAIGTDARGVRWRELRVSGSDLPPAQGESGAALRFSVPPRGAGSWSWRALGDHYLSLTGDAPDDPTVRAAAAILQGADAGALVDAAFRLVQSRVRYHADEERMHAYVARAPGKVLANGYGDCKEMVGLLRALLAARGVAAQPALARTPGFAGPAAGFPSFADFDHMVLSVPRRDGTRRWFDPTVAAAGPGSSWLPQLGRQALVLIPGASGLDTIRAPEGYRNRVVTVSRLGPCRAGVLELRGSIGLKGGAAFALNQCLRRDHPGPSEARAAMRAFLADAFSIRASEWEWSDPAPDSVAITYAMPAGAMRLTLAAGGVILDAPSLMGLGSPGGGPRRLEAFEQEDTWILPPGYRQGESRAFEREGMAGAWEMAGGEARRRFRCLGLERGPGLLDDLAEFSLASVWQ